MNDLKRLYGRLIDGLLILESSSSVRLYDGEMLETITSCYRDTMLRIIKIRVECEKLIAANNAILQKTIFHQSQSRFVPNGTSLTFADEAVTEFKKGQGLFWRLMTVMESNESIGWKMHYDYEIWAEFGHKRTDFEDLKRGLAWEWSAIQNIHVERPKRDAEATKGKQRPLPPLESQEERLAKIPELDETSGDWVLAKKLGFAITGLNTGRREGIKSSDGLKGIDRANRMWRKKSFNAKKVFYYCGKS